MLSAGEFTVGSIGQANPLSLVLPRHDGEETLLIAQTPKGSPAAFFLSENNRYGWFESADNGYWHGLIIPNVRIELDLSSIFEPRRTGHKPGTAVRRGSQLIVQAKANSIHSFNGLEPIILEDSLWLTTEEEEIAGFHRWQVVLGSGQEKRILHTVSAG